MFINSTSVFLLIASLYFIQFFFQSLKSHFIQAQNNVRLQRHVLFKRACAFLINIKADVFLLITGYRISYKLSDWNSNNLLPFGPLCQILLPTAVKKLVQFIQLACLFFLSNSLFHFIHGQNEKLLTRHSDEKSGWKRLRGLWSLLPLCAQPVQLRQRQVIWVITGWVVGHHRLKAGSHGSPSARLPSGSF